MQALGRQLMYQAFFNITRNMSSKVTSKKSLDYVYYSLLTFFAALPHLCLRLSPEDGVLVDEKEEVVAVHAQNSVGGDAEGFHRWAT